MRRGARYKMAFHLYGISGQGGEASEGWRGQRDGRTDGVLRGVSLTSTAVFFLTEATGAVGLPSMSSCRSREAYHDTLTVKYMCTGRYIKTPWPRMPSLGLM